MSFPSVPQCSPVSQFVWPVPQLQGSPVPENLVTGGNWWGKYHFRNWGKFSPVFPSYDQIGQL